MLKVLIIEDEMDIAELLKINLTKQGWEISIANDGYKAVNLIVSNKPDVIILDLGLPYLEGDIVLSMFNEKKITENIPVIITSAKDEKDIIAAQQKIGAKAYMRKPVDIDKLVELIKKIAA